MARLAGKPKAAAKTPSKVPTPIRKKKENPIVAPSPKPNGDNGFKKFSDDLDESVLKVDESTPAKKKKSTQRKLDDSQLGGIDDTLNNGEISNIHDVKNSDDGNDPNETTFLDGEKKRKKTSESHSDTLEEMQKNVTTADEELQTTKTKDINCVLCGKRFSQKSLLREHIELSHMGEKLKECPNCSMEFRSLQKYESHVFGEKCKGTLHPCQFDNCHRRFKNVHKMEIHMRQKHLSISEDLE